MTNITDFDITLKIKVKVSDKNVIQMKKYRNVTPEYWKWLSKLKLLETRDILQDSLWVLEE